MNEPRKPKTAPRVVHAHAEFVVPPVAPKRHRTRWILGDPDADAVEQEVTEHVRKRRGKDAMPTAERKAKDVERFELLAKATVKVPTAPTRKIYVDKRDGSIGEITARDIADKLLEREAIAGAVADGVRPKSILCAVCRCVVAVKKKGLVPSFCAEHRDKTTCPRCSAPMSKGAVGSCQKCRSTEDRSKASRDGQMRRSPEERRRSALPALSAITAEMKRAANEKRRRYANDAERVRAGRERAKARRSARPRLRPETVLCWVCDSEVRVAEVGTIPKACAKHNEFVKCGKCQASPVLRGTVCCARCKTPGDRREILRKAWETRRAKKAAEKAGEQ